MFVVSLSRRAASVLLLLVAVAAAAAEESAPQGRLPLGVTPERYSLEFAIDPAAERFSGQASIDLHFAAATRRFWLHGRDLDVGRAVLTTPTGREIPARYEEVVGGIARIVAAETLEASKARLILDYTAPFGPFGDGLYRVKEGGETYAFTHLQPIDARRVFPAFDEPRFKTPFDIAVTVPEADVAISNAPEASVGPAGPGRKRIVFQTTEPLPTYLVALAVGPLDVVDWEPIAPTPWRARPIPLRGVAVKGKGQQLAYALDNTAAMLEILEDYFAAPYPFTKLDIVAVPQFGPSGMENAAAIFYREDRLLFGEVPSVWQRRGYAFVHAHELAHSWFGNYVTPAWWDDLWLNESFATWMAEHVVSRWRPQDFDDRGAQRNAARAMWTDRLPSTRAVRQPIVGNEGIGNAFDRITYNKGGGVLAMFERYMGETAFREGVRRYIGRFPYGVATADDFMAALAESAEDHGIVAAKRTLVEQPGIPLLDIDWQCEGEAGTAVEIRQSRYVPPGLAVEPEPLWRLPVCLAYEEGGGRRRHCVTVSGPLTRTDLPDTACPAWLLPNEGGAGYFLWSLPSAGWRALLAAFDSLTTAEQLALLTAASGAYRYGDLGLADYLAFARRGAASEAWDLAEAPMQLLRDIKNFVLPRELQPAIKALYWDFYRPSLARFDLSDRALARGAETSEEALLLSDLLWFLALDADEPALRRQLGRLGRAYLGFGGDGKIRPEAVHGDYVRLAMTVAAQDGGLPLVEHLIKLLVDSRDGVLRENITAALAYLTEPAAVARVQELILDPRLPPREASRLLYRQSNRVANRDAVWTFLRDEEEAILERIPESHHSGLVWIPSAFCAADRRREIAAYFEPRLDAWDGSRSKLAQVLDLVDLCIALADLQRADAVAFVEGLGGEERQGGEAPDQ